jgi:hypothetical protein
MGAGRLMRRRMGRARAAFLFIAAMLMHFALRLPVTWLAGREWLAANATHGLVSRGWHSFHEPSEKGRLDTGAVTLRMRQPEAAGGN